MKEYKYRENINDTDGNTVGCREIVVPNNIVEQIRADVIDECIQCLVMIMPAEPFLKKSKRYEKLRGKKYVYGYT